MDEGSGSSRSPSRRWRPTGHPGLERRRGPDRHLITGTRDDQPRLVLIAQSDAALPRLVLLVLAVQEEDSSTLQEQEKVRGFSAQVDAVDRCLSNRAKKPELLLGRQLREIVFTPGRRRRKAIEERPSRGQIDVDLSIEGLPFRVV